MTTRSAPNRPTAPASSTARGARGGGAPPPRPPSRIREPPRTRHHLVRHLPQHTVALLEYREHGAHRTFASSRNRRSSSGTAAAPSPTIFPSLRAGGSVRASTSTDPAANTVGFTARGFFFAAMIPFKAGSRGSFNPLSAVSTAGSGNSTTSTPPSTSRSALPRPSA